MTHSRGLQCSFTMNCNPAEWHVAKMHRMRQKTITLCCWCCLTIHCKAGWYNMRWCSTKDWQGSMNGIPNIVECKADVEGTDLQQGMLAEKGRRKAWMRPRFASCARCACCSLMSCRKQCMRVACMSAWGCCCHVALSISSVAPQIGMSGMHHYDRRRLGDGWEGLSWGGGEEGSGGFKGSRWCEMAP